MPEKNILIADDDQEILDILKEMIQREGYKVFLASNGKEAVEAIKINPIDLAILDIKMPVMDGIEALKEIKKIDQGIESLIITGYAELETLTQAISDHGAFDYILKPFKRVDILNGIQNALLKRDFASQKKLREKELEERIIQLEKQFHERTHRLRESQIKYRDIVENSNDAIVVVQDGKLKFANTKTVELTGYPQEDLKDMSFLEMVHPEDRDMVAESYKSEVFPNIFSFRALRKSGEYFWVEINAVRTTWERRQATLNIIRDITERKQAEEALHREKEKFRVLVEGSPLGVSLIGKDGRYKYINPKFFEMFGYSIEDIPTGREWFRRAYPDKEYRNQVISTWIGDLKESIVGESRPRTFTVTCKDGSEKVIHFRPVAMETGEQFVICEDITERKQSEEALRESEEKYQSLVESTEDSIYLLDRNCKYLFMNRKHLSRFGLAAEKAIGRTYAEFHSEDDTKELVGKAEKVFETGKSLSYEYRSERDGRYYIRTLSPVKDPDGRTRSVTVVSKDITERKQAEEALKQANAELLKEHNQRRILSKRLIDLLEKDRRQIAMELHDQIGQTLTSLKMNLEMIHEKLKPGHTDLGAQITAAQERTIQTIKDVKNISHGLRPAVIDALGVVSSLRELFNEMKQQMDIEIHFFSRGIPKRFEEGKELAIYRIVQEALGNIIRHAQAKNVFVNLVKKDEKLSLSVEDDGVGFNQDKVIKPSKRRGPLGLLIMRERAIQLNGEFNIESPPGKGTHLLVEIPL